MFITMKNKLKYLVIISIILVSACKSSVDTGERMRQNDPLFEKGNLVDSPNFAGTVWLNMMGATDSTIHVSYGNVTFEPGARTNWHSHPGGQLLFITEGKGYYQVKDEPARLLSKGDFVEIPRNVIHWHGAAPDSGFSHIAVSLNTDDGGAVWTGPVTDEEYQQATK